MFIIGRYIILNYYFYSAVILILFLISIEDFITYKIKNKRLISLLFLFLIYPMIYAVDNVMFFWSRGDEFDDVQNLLRGNTIFADNMFLKHNLQMVFHFTIYPIILIIFTHLYFTRTITYIPILFHQYFLFSLY